jgi:hypothetical protein
MTSLRRWSAAAILAALLPAPCAAAGVELAPFAGFQFGGSVNSTAGGIRFELDEGLDLGATLDLEVAEGWRVELLFSHQEGALESRFDVDRVSLDVQRYLAGIQEEHDYGRTKFFGVALVGATRFAPGLDGYDSDVRFTLGLGLGVKHWLTPRFGLRAETRGFFVDVDSGAGVVCRGGCLFVFNGSGLWQGDVTAGVSLSF